ncbi:MAG: hypothetical protein J6N20_00260 [Pseudomonas sp.]|nr:hypothetical protein [Pseudomonas sp.]
MRYICICCGNGGGDGNPYNARVGPYNFNCHVCKKYSTMWPEPQASKYLKTIGGLLEGHGKDDADRRAITVLQEQLNHQRAAMASASLVIESLNATIELGLKIVDQILPYCGTISIDVGAANEFCMRARK